MSNQDIIKIDFSHFPIDDRFAQIPGKLFMVDNIDEDNDVHYDHQHPDYPVQVTMGISFLCLSGKIEMNIGLDSYTLQKNQALIIFPGTFLHIKSFTDDVRVIFTAISPDFTNYSQDIKLGVEFGRELSQNPINTLSDENVKELLDLHRIVKKVLRDPNYQFKEEVAKSYLNIIKCNIFQKFLDTRSMHKEDKPSSRKEEIFYNFIASVREHYKENRNIGFYASKLFMSPKYLSSVVHEVSGKYATEWINQYVILEAKALLRSPGMTVKDVTFCLNFANQSFFAKFFKQHTGYTPREYMNM